VVGKQEPAACTPAIGSRSPHWLALRGGVLSTAEYLLLTPASFGNPETTGAGALRLTRSFLAVPKL
jgi:hypothetical protein